MLYHAYAGLSGRGRVAPRLIAQHCRAVIFVENNNKKIQTRFEKRNCVDLPLKRKTRRVTQENETSDTAAGTAV